MKYVISRPPNHLVPPLCGGTRVATLRVAGGLTPGVPVRSALPAPLLAGVAVAAVVAMTLGSAVAERSFAEGLTRGVIEAVAIGTCFLLLARRLGLRG